MLPYAEVRDKTLFKKKCELYEQWLAVQPPIVDRQPYTPPDSLPVCDTDISGRNGARLTCAEQWERLLEERDRRELVAVADGSPVGDDQATTLPEPGVTMARCVKDSTGVTTTPTGDNWQVEEQPSASGGDSSDNSIADSDTATSVSAGSDIDHKVSVATLGAICMSIV